jgi:hypothetical protein
MSLATNREDTSLSMLSHITRGRGIYGRVFYDSPLLLKHDYVYRYVYINGLERLRMALTGVRVYHFTLYASTA